MWEGGARSRRSGGMAAERRARAVLRVGREYRFDRFLLLALLVMVLISFLAVVSIVGNRASSTLRLSSTSSSALSRRRASHDPRLHAVSECMGVP